MATIANSKNTYLKRLTITQIGSHKSNCTLQSVFLKKPENYTLQIERFIIDITPNINLIKGPYIEVLRRPGHEDTFLFGLQEVGTLLDLGGSDFTPVAPKSVLDVFTQLETFCTLHDGLDVMIGHDYKISFGLTAAFGDIRYLKLNSVFAELLQLPEYIYYFSRHNILDEPGYSNGDGIETVVSTLNESGNDYTQDIRLFYTQEEADNDLTIANVFGDIDDNLTLFAASAEPEADAARVWIESLDTLKSIDTRLSFEVNCTLPSDSKLDILGRDPSLKRITARFPIRDLIEEYNTFGLDTFELTEKINVGIENICRGNPNTQTLNLHQGEIRMIHTDIIVRYLENKKITLVPAEFGDTGFFSLVLLFTKRIK